MIYWPSVYDDWIHEWGRIDRLLLLDPVLYYWLHWMMQQLRTTQPEWWPYEMALRRISHTEFHKLYYGNWTPPTNYP